MSRSPDIPGAPDKEIFRIALEVLSTGVVLLDRARKIIFWNDGAETITGLPPHDALGHIVQANILGQCNGTSCVHCGAVCPVTRLCTKGNIPRYKAYSPQGRTLGASALASASHPRSARVGGGRRPKF